MGNVLSSSPERGRDAVHVTSESETMNKEAEEHDNAEEEFHDAANEDEARTRAKEEEMNEFQQQLSIKREQRKEILTRHRTEKEKLEKSLKEERTAKLELLQKNEQLRDLLLKNNIEIPDTLQTSESAQISEAIVQMREEFDKLRDDNIKLRREISQANRSLQGAYSDMADLNGQNLESMKQIQALKEVVSVSKTLIGLREGQLNELKEKLAEIERSLSEREASMLSTDLRQEYERQLQNIRSLRTLYEERARLAEVSRQGLLRDIEEHKALYQIENNKCKDLTEKVEALEAKVDALEDTIENKNNEISTCQDESNGLKAEMAVVNKLFSQVLLGYKTKQDLDKLVHRLEENHGLLTHMAENEDDAEASSALPKMLLELVSQVDENDEAESSQPQENTSSNTEAENKEKESATVPSTTPEEIVENLPKVWRVLMELLSHQTVTEDSAEKVTTCYKSVETKSGPVLVPSVSQTYIRLKDLIVEKLGLIKEVNRMKQLNSHLESRLQEQEKRLCLVTTELGKTWHVVGKLRRHHYQLHTHEKILKYELQQKRKLLNELKEELEYCREKWEQAREKNTQSERDWRKLRAEFTSRKTKSGSPSFNNSGESGYSDERPSDDSSESNDESEYVAEPLNRCKKKMKKSLENILDSSADCNLAEREDPVSDMLDVADLPLDTLDGEASSECSKSEPILKSERTCETEDEICDIAHDEVINVNSSENNTLGASSSGFLASVVEDNSESSKTTTLSESSCSTETQADASTLIDPATILLNIKRQNERLAKKDARLEKLEKGSADLLKKTLMTTKVSQEINSTLDHLINRPTSNSTQNTVADINQLELDDNLTGMNNNLQTGTLESEIEQNTPDASEINNLRNETETQLSSSLQNDLTSLHEEIEPQCTSSPTPITDFKAILENVKQQNERLAKKDERLHTLEEGCTEVVQNMSNTLSTGNTIVEKLDTLHSKHGNDDQAGCSGNSNTLQTTDNIEDDKKDNCEPSTSTEIDHEARFAARDLRLKRLEEQTKSLVKKVNKTTSKGVKINYKLDELHSIYGSESSRAGTPSEDTEDRSIDEDNENTE